MKISEFLMVVVFELLMYKVSGDLEKNSHLDNNVDIIYKEIASLRAAVQRLTQQVMMQQVFIEERIRTEGGSGVKVVRSNGWGLKNYNSATYLNGKAFSIHDHSDYDRTVGLGEMAVVLNGVDFKTRHNDYKLVMPSRTSNAYHALDNIPFPDVPPEVLSQSTIEEQIEEMKKWFLAFKDQNKTERDYTKYFKPVLCYLEGAWTFSKDLEEPFPSDRHRIEAKSWQELHQKIRFMSQTGLRSRLENLAFLPTTIMSVNETTGEPTYAQWNYRILCSPVGFDIPLSHFHQENDLAFQMSSSMKNDHVRETRAGRFKLFDGEKDQKHSILDKIFATIPGKDNYGANLTLQAFDDDVYDASKDSNLLLNTGFYHRSYKLYKKGASGLSFAPLGFNDENMWMAQTTQENIAPVESKRCSVVQVRPSTIKKVCSSSMVRVSHAIPLEIIYLTPLLSWNPYNITYNTDSKLATRNGRNGQTAATAFNGVDKMRYYMTPVEFFSGKLVGTDPADTVKLYTFVLAKDGKPKKVAASGTRIILQNIEGVGKIRLRYPIAPVHGEGSPVWKELNALKDKVWGDTDKAPPSTVLFQMTETTRNPPGEHTHDVTITYDEFLMLHKRMSVNVTSDVAQGHSHKLVLTYKPSRNYTYTTCGGFSRCWDGHPRPLTLLTDNEHITKVISARNLRSGMWNAGSSQRDNDFCDNDLECIKSFV